MTIKDPEKYNILPPENVIELAVAFRDMYGKYSIKFKNLNPVPLNEKNYEFYCKNGNHYNYYTMWGTDLLPHEIQNNIDNLEEISKKINTEVYYFCGSLQNHNMYKNYLNSKNIVFQKFGGTFRQNHPNNLSIEQHMKTIQKSVIAPAFQFNTQLTEKYVPCRIFKNISYGRMGITNNKFVNELFDNKLIYNEDVNKCIDMGLEFEKRSDKLDIIKELMYKVKEDHVIHVSL